MSSSGVKTTLRDLRIACRAVWRSPLFAVVAISVMAVGIGAVSSMYSIFNEIRFRPYPFAEASELLVVQAAKEGDSEHYGVSEPDFVDLRRRVRVFGDLAAVRQVTLSVTEGDTPFAVEAARVSPNFFDLLGLDALSGRLIRENRDATGDRVVVLAEDLWQSAFGRDPEIVHRWIGIGGTPYRIVGVLASAERFPDRTEVWIPMDGDVAPEERRSRGLLVIGRLAPDAPVGEVQAELDRIAVDLAKAYPDTNRGWGFTTSSLADFRTGPWGPMLVILSLLAVFVLLVACINVSVLLLDRAISRRHELAIREALGARRAQILRILLAECLMITLAGGAVGLLLSRWLLSSIVLFIPEDFPFRFDFDLDLSVYGATLLACMVGAFLGGALPALQASGERVATALKWGTGQTAGRQRRRLRTAFVVGEIALSFVLLVVAAVLVRSFWALQETNPGHRLEDVVAAELVLHSDPYSDAAQRLALYRLLQDELATIPGVRSAAAGSFLPFESWGRSYIRVKEAGDPEVDLMVGVQRIYGDYFETLGLPLLAGRLFDSRDRAGGEPVLVINDALAARLWPGERAVGKHLWVAGDEIWRTVVGVVRNIKRVGFYSGELDVYIPYLQSPLGSMTLLVGARGDPMDLMPAIRGSVAGADAGIPIKRLATLEEELANGIAPQRALGFLVSVFGLAALVLAVTGLYGFVSYSVTQRRKELGIRMALGASSRAVVLGVFSRVLVLVALGLGVGLLLTVPLTYGMRAFLVGVSPLDPLSYMGQAALLAAAAILAALHPAFRAARTVPAETLSSE